VKSIIFDFDGVFGDTLEPVTEFLSRLTWQPKSKVRAGVLKLLMQNQKENRLQRYFKDMLAPKLEKFLLSKENCLFHERIEEIQNVKVPMAILTNNYSTICRKLLGNYAHLFELIIGDNEADTKLKGFELIFKHPGFSKNTTVFITDSVGDILEASSILKKSQIYGVSWGFHSPEVLKDYLPKKHILTDFKSLNQHIANHTVITSNTLQSTNA
jgi:phosphoglycolate phosphatase-like HAD superfamily hydrolase